MFKNFLNKVKENEEKLKNRANVLFDKTKEKKATDTTSKKYSLKGLGDNEESELSILNDKKIWDTNGKERSTSKPHTTKENKEQTPKKEETEVDKTIKEREKDADKDIAKAVEMAKEENKIRTKSLSLKDLDLDEDKYEIVGDTISQKKKEKEFDEIDNVKYPNNTGNKKVEELKQQAKENRSKRLKEDNTEYLKNNALAKQYGVDTIDKKGQKGLAKLFFGKEAAENLHLSKTKSYLDTPYAKEHKLFNSYEEAPNNLKNYFKDKITGQIGKDKLDKTKGLYIDANSKS